MNAKINELPTEIQDKVKETLMYWQGCYAFRENGAYSVSVGIALTTRKNPEDFKSWHFTQDDVFTREEQAANSKSRPSFELF